MNKEQPLVTIVIPVYNGERYVGITLDSVLKQSWRELEIIVVNDGSTDRTMEICRQFKDKRIRYVEQENRGLAATRNAGIESAKGEYIGFIDADDIWLPEKITKHMEQFRLDENLGLSYSFSSFIDEDGKSLGTFQKEGTNPTTFRDVYVKNVIGNGSNAILRMEVFSGRDSVAGSFPPMHSFDPDFRHAEDFELWSRIAGQTQWQLACIPEVLVKYRINSSGLSSNTKLQRHYHLLALAKIGEKVPFMAERYRKSAVAHLYWHQARTHTRQKYTRPGLRAVKIALRYNWRSLNSNHFLMGSALACSLILPRSVYLEMLFFGGHVWGWWQRVQIYHARKTGEKSHVDVPEKMDMSEMIGSPESYAREKALPNLFFLCHKHQLMFLGISKNASTTLKHVMYQEEFCNSGQNIQHGIHKIWGWSPEPGKVIRNGDTKALQDYSGYTRFAVYRDPVSRFLSTYHNKVIYSHFTHPYYLENRLEGMALDHFIDVTEVILRMKNPLHMDEHLRPQAYYYKAEDVDFIVPIESLPKFLKDRFGIVIEKDYNVTSLPRIIPNEQQRERIRKLYACDYEIEPNWP